MGPKLVTLSHLLKERGWTAKLVAQFKLEPDKIKPNPHYRAGPPMKLFLLTRIKRIEKGKKFQEALADSQRGARDVGPLMTLEI